MTAFKTRLTWVGAHIWWFALVALPFVVVACNNGGSGGNGY